MALISIFDASIPVFLHGLTTLKNVIAKGQEFSPAIDPAKAAIIADMKPLVFQVQTCSNTAKKSIQRLTGNDNLPVWEDDETTFPQLLERIDKTIALLKEVKADDVAAREDATITMQTGAAGELQVSAPQYVLGFGLPNFFFHLVTAYDILRKEGVEIGKGDYIRPFMAP